MEESYSIDNEDLICKCCETEIAESDDFCSECGFPLKGTEKEQGKHIGKYVVGALDEESGKSGVKKSKNALLIIAGILVASGIWVSKGGGEAGAFIVVTNIVLAVIFAFLAMWSEKNPFSAFLTALILFISLQILFLLADPLSIISGILFKFVIIFFLVNGITSAAKLKK